MSTQQAIMQGSPAAAVIHPIRAPATVVIALSLWLPSTPPELPGSNGCSPSL